MPLVRVRYNPDCFHEVDNLRIACSEVVPAAFNSSQGRLTPGSIEFFADPAQPHVGMHCDVFVEVEAFYYVYYDDREENLDYRTKALQSALRGLFPKTTFVVWSKLVMAGWVSDVNDPEFDGDMSMSAAVERARFLLAELRTTS